MSIDERAEEILASIFKQEELDLAAAFYYNMED